jgi:hypothetical protein
MNKDWKECKHCWRDLGLNLAECRWCGMVIMHDMSHAEFALQECLQAPEPEKPAEEQEDKE